MKKFFTVALLLLSISSFGQTFEKSEVYVLDSTYNKSIIYSKCLEWIGKNFNSAQNVIQVSDKDAGKIIVKGLLLSLPKSGYFGNLSHGTYFTLDIAIKDGKCKVIVSNLYVIFEPNIRNEPKKGLKYSYDDIVENGIPYYCKDKCKDIYKKEIEKEVFDVFTSIQIFLKTKSDF